MQIETLQGSADGKKYDIAPSTVFDAVKVSEQSDETLSDVIASMQGEKETVTALNGGYAIPMEWADGNPANDDRLGKFVTLVPGARKIKIAGPNDVIYGVTTMSAAYVENYANISNDSSKIFVCIFGGVTVQCKENYTDTDLNNGVKVFISEAGNATKNGTEYGYPVTSIVDDTHIAILLIPNLESVSRLAAQMNSIIARFPEDIVMSVQNGDVIISHQTNEPDTE